MFFRISFILTLLGFVNLSAASNIHDFVDVAVKHHQQFTNKERPVYLECYEARSSVERQLALRSFEIKIKNGPEKDTVVGKIGTKYDPKNQCIEIGSLEIYENYRRRGYGEAALRTALGIYRSQNNQALNFNRFYLTVGLGDDRLAARNLYKKVGFKIAKDLSHIGYVDMALDR